MLPCTGSLIYLKVVEHIEENKDSTSGGEIDAAMEGSKSVQSYFESVFALMHLLTFKQMTSTALGVINQEPVADITPPRYQS